MRRTPAIGEPSYLEARGLATALRRLATAWKRAWTPKVAPDPVEWAEGGGVVLPASVAARGIGGRLSFRTRPYWRLVLRWLVQEGVEQINVEVGAQCGKTTGGISFALYCGEFLPGPTLYLMPSEEHAEDLTRDRLRPIFQASPFGKTIKANDLRLGGASFPGGGSLNVIGVGSPNALKARPARNVIFDEYDEAVRYNKAAGSPLERARTRTRTYSGVRKILVLSTPTIDTDGIHPEYASSQMWEWQVRCPLCGDFHALELGNLGWPRDATGEHSMDPDEIVTTSAAWYTCPHCLGRWNDAQRIQAISDGRGHCLTPERPALSVGIRMSAMYSPDVSLSQFAAAFLRAQADPVKMIQFRNEWLAEPRTETVKSASTDQAHLAARQFAGYQMPGADWWETGEVPPAPDWVRAITWGFDVQGAEVWGLCRGWGDRGESIILWAGSFRGAGDLENARTASRLPWLVGGSEMIPIRSLMDSGYRTHEVYRVCAGAPRLLPSKGRQDGTLPVQISQVDRQGANRRVVGRTDLVVVWTTYWQDEVARALEQEPGRGPIGCHLPSNPPAYLYRHLCAEKKKTVQRKDGRAVVAWVAHDSQNHLRDCLVLSQVAAGLAKVHDLPPRRRGISPVEADPEPVEATDEVTATEQAAAQARPAKRPGMALSALLAARGAKIRDAGSIVER